MRDFLGVLLYRQIYLYTQQLNELSQQIFKPSSDKHIFVFVVGEMFLVQNELLPLTNLDLTRTSPP